MESNGTLWWSNADAQPLEPWVLHLGPSVAGLGPTLKRHSGASKLRPGRFWRSRGGGDMHLDPSAVDLGADLKHGSGVSGLRPGRF